MFDVKKYKNTKFEHQVFNVPLPSVFKEFFDKGEKPVWKVRGLTGQEVGRATMAAQKNKNIAAMFEAAESGLYAKMVKLYKEFSGTDNSKTPQQIAEVVEKIIIGSVEPQADIELVVLLCTRSPVAFFDIHSKIKELTEGGMMPGKPKGSGKTKVSK